MKRFLGVFSVVLAIAVLTFIFCLRDRYVVPILTYHNVSDGDVCKGGGHACLNNVTPASFARQMDFLKKHGYRVIDFDDFMEGMEKGRQFARNTVLIQFDDGYEDNYTNAFPVLKRHQFPAMVFVVSDFIGTNGYLTWEQVKEMDAHGFKAGAHTRRHKYLPSVSPAEARDEIAGSKKTIEGRLGHRIDYLAYPSGGFTQDVQQVVKEAGFRAAVTTNRGKDKFNRDFFALQRIRVKDSDNALVLWAKSSGYYNLFRENKDGH